MVSFKAILAYAALSSAVLAEPLINNTELSYNDITNMDTNLIELDVKVKTYKGGLLSALPQIPLAIQVALATISGELHSTMLPNPLPVDDLLYLADHINKTIALSGPKAVATFICKKSYYEVSGLKDPVHRGMQAFLALIQLFTSNIVNRVPANAPADIVDILKKDVQAFTDALQRGIEVFSSD
jgi:hypothetical protein